MSHKTLTEHKAQLAIEGFQDGALDHIDLICMIEDFDGWTEESDSDVARECRGEVT